MWLFVSYLLSSTSTFVLLNITGVPKKVLPHSNPYSLSNHISKLVDDFNAIYPISSSKLYKIFSTFYSTITCLSM